MKSRGTFISFLVLVLSVTIFISLRDRFWPDLSPWVRVITTVVAMFIVGAIGGVLRKLLKKQNEE